jgi:glycosyltransferase involved in cell wall biosynthesis
MALKIAIYAISLNEEKFVERFYQSCKDADYIILADTGSTDNTVQVARDLGIDVYSIAVTPWRFDTARNIALGLVPKDVDVCMALDLDEIMTPGWRESIERNWQAETTRLQYRFDNGGGNVFNATKIHKRTGYTWHHLIHEMIEIDPRVTETWAVTEDLLVQHKPDNTKSRGQYLPMLEAAIKESPYDSRDRWYLAREYWYYKQYENSIREFDHYLTMPGATWHHERSFALRHIGHCYMALGKHEIALKNYRLAVDESRYIRDTWMDLAQACYELKQWQECLYASLQGLSITRREHVFTSGPQPWGYKLHDLAALAAYNLGMKDTAVRYGIEALEHNPEDARLRKNLDHYLA